jgi:hypothetical protein
MQNKKLERIVFDSFIKIDIEIINPSTNQFETQLTFGHKVFDNKISDKQMLLYVRPKEEKNR